MVRQKLQLICLLALIPLYAVGEVYQWRDASGRLQFSDRAPADSEIPVQRIETALLPQRERLRIHEHHSDIALSTESRERMQQGIQHIFGMYTRRLGLDVRSVVEVNLHLFSSRADYQNWVSERIGRRAISTGIFITASNEVAVWQWGSEEQIVTTILHEVSHVILHQLAPNTPVWLHEGLAQYFQTIKPDGDQLRVDPIPEAMALIRQWVDRGDLISVHQYLSIPQNQWMAMVHDRSAIPYTLAWGLVYFMMSRPVGEQTIRRILHDLEKSGLPPTLDRIESRYPGGLLQLDTDFFRWAQSTPKPHWY